jgi:Family of unknown function (DUF6516)
MDAVLLEYQKLTISDGAIIEVKVWQLPEPTAERPHGLKYSLFFGRPGERIVSYDNEAGKGDHRHYRGRERPYRFTTFEALLADFWRDVREELGHE